MIEPLHLDFDVAGTPERVFELWTERISAWWPPGHTISGDADAVTIEPGVGGRIYERSGEDQHQWGVVTRWNPPNVLGFTWHLFFPPEEATDVTVTFVGIESGTRIHIEQTGWDRLGVAGPPRREKTHSVWTTLVAELAKLADELA